MKFRALISDYSTFSKLISSFTLLSKTAILKLTTTQLHFICQSPLEGSIQVWSHINVSSIFEEEGFNIESNSNNEIYLQISTEALSRALKSAHGSTRVAIKLAKKGGKGPNGQGAGSTAVLILMFSSRSNAGRSMEVIQDVGVKVMKPADMLNLNEPMCPIPEVNTRLPNLHTIKTIADRLKAISPFVQISGNSRGEFRLRAEGDAANVQTEWRGLTNTKSEAVDLDNKPVNPEEFFDVVVDAKDLIKFLGSSTIATTSIGCICAGHCFIIYVYIGDSSTRNGGILTFFLPAITSGN